MLIAAPPCARARGPLRSCGSLWYLTRARRNVVQCARGVATRGDGAGLARTDKDGASRRPVLRFAPSPTGQLHLGGLRTALFNHLLAKKLGGTWILRVEDTDSKRLVLGAVEAMQEVLAWAGLQYDQGPGRDGDLGPYIQSQRLDIYSKYVDRLVQVGHAYKDFREAESGSPSSFDDYVAPSAEEARDLEAAGKSSVVRMRLPQRKTVLDDIVYGRLEFPYDRATDDPILVKSDGWPTYHLASVVDDTEMQVTHVLRGEEWLPSVPIHLALYEALGLTPPKFAHLPLLINPDGSKLSKRHADVHVESYRQAGFEPEALVNFVALMGANWHQAAPHAAADDDAGSEVFSMQDMIARFSVDRITHSRATPNLEKLHFLNRQHLRRQLADHPESRGRQDLLARLGAKLDPSSWQGSEFPADQLEQSRLGFVAEFVLERSSSVSEMVRDLQALFQEPALDGQEARDVRSAIDDAVYERAIRTGVDLLSSLTEAEVDDPSRVDAALSSHAKTLNALLAKEVSIPAGGDSNTKKTKWKGRGALLRPLRHALTGKGSGPTVGDTMAVLGRARSLARIEAAAKR